jgi:predicted nucleotide-binding protein
MNNISSSKTSNIPLPPRISGFLRACRGRSQELIIMEFLEAAIEISPTADEGSVLIHHPRMKKLVLFNENDFLFEKKMLDPKIRAAWPKEFSQHSGIAGRCFRERSTQVYSRQIASKMLKDFLGDSPIQNMICIPIITSAPEPFGVVCFHNNDPDREFTEIDEKVLETYTDILALALHSPHPELQLERNVFIVHGRDSQSLSDLQDVLRDFRVSPKVLGQQDRNAQSILYALEDLIRTCRAGFILITPDDEGHLKGDRQLSPRARENVIFETGMLFARFREFDRVALLVKRPVELPSDLDGILFQAFDNISDIERYIESKLNKWKLLR